MSEVRIRPLEEKDIPRAVEIESAILGSKRSATLRGSLTAYLAKGDRNACLAAEMDGTLVGFLIGEVRTWDFGEDQEVPLGAQDAVHDVHGPRLAVSAFLGRQG